MKTMEFSDIEIYSLLDNVVPGFRSMRGNQELNVLMYFVALSFDVRKMEGLERSSEENSYFMGREYKG